MRVAVVGAGVAGLSVAFEITRRVRSADVQVLEAADRAGGNLRTERVDGYVCEWGPNGFLDSVPETLTLVDALGLRDRLLVSSDAARRRFLYRHRRLIAVPESPIAFLTSPILSVPGRLRVLGEPVARARPDGDETIHAFAARRIGHEAADVLIDAMVSGVFGGDARELSLRACFPKMWDMETEHGGLVRAMIARRRARKAPDQAMGAPAGRLTSFAGGVQDLVDGLTRALDGRIHLERPVTGLTRSHDGRWAVHTEDGATRDADAVVLAGGARSTAPIVHALDPQLASALDEIPSAPMIVVALGYRLEGLAHPLDGFGFLVPRGEGLRILGALWDSSIYPGRAPEGHALLRMMLGGAHDPGVIALDDEQVTAIARRELHAAMGIDVAPVFSGVFRHPAGIPQYTVGHAERLERIDAALAGLPGLHVAGNSYRGVAINSCVADAGPLADRVLAGS